MIIKRIPIDINKVTTARLVALMDRATAFYPPPDYTVYYSGDDKAVIIRKVVEENPATYESVLIVMFENVQGLVTRYDMYQTRTRMRNSAVRRYWGILHELRKMLSPAESEMLRRDYPHVHYVSGRGLRLEVSSINGMREELRQFYTVAHTMQFSGELPEQPRFSTDDRTQSQSPPAGECRVGEITTLVIPSDGVFALDVLLGWLSDDQVMIREIYPEMDMALVQHIDKGNRYRISMRYLACAQGAPQQSQRQLSQRMERIPLTEPQVPSRMSMLEFDEDEDEDEEEEPKWCD